MNRLLADFAFCKDDKRFGGAVEIRRGDYGDRSVIEVQLRVGSRTSPLSRNRLREVIEALMLADEEASKQYRKLLEEMNDAVQQEVPERLQEGPGQRAVSERDGS